MTTLAYHVLVYRRFLYTMVAVNRVVVFVVAGRRLIILSRIRKADVP